MTARRRRTPPGFTIASLLGTLVFATVIAGCGGDGSTDQDAAADLSERVDAATQAAQDSQPSAESPEGEVSFEVDGVSYTFDHLVADETYYLSMASAAVAKPDPDAVERFILTIASMDLADWDYPAELPPPDRAASIRTASMLIGFSFTNAEGDEWAGPAVLTVESFDDGMLVATFTEATLPHTDGEHPPVTLTDGRIRAQLR